MANYSKNIFIGLGGKVMIDQTYFPVGGSWYSEDAWTGGYTPIRAVFDYAHERFLKELPLNFLLSVVGD